MKKRKPQLKLWGEAIIAASVLVLLLVSTVPDFLSSQRKGMEKRIHHDLSILLNALQHYSLDYPQISSATGLRDHLIRSIREQTGNPQIYKSGSYGQYVHVIQLSDVPFLANYLKEKGYIEPGQRLLHYVDSESEASIYYLTAIEQNNEIRIHLIGLAVLWPFIDQSILETELATAYNRFDRNKFTSTALLNEVYQTLLKKDFYFSITNGMSSFGYIYCDTLDNHSFVGR